MCLNFLKFYRFLGVWFVVKKDIYFSFGGGLGEVEKGSEKGFFVFRILYWEDVELSFFNVNVFDVLCFIVW